MRHLYYPRCETWNRWRSVDAHFHDGAGSMLLLLLPIKEANTSVMTSCNQCPVWLPRMQDLKSLMLRSCSFPGWGRELLCTYFDHKGGQFIQNEHRHTIVNILRLTVRYLNATINRTTLNAKPEIGPDGSSQTRCNPQIDGYGAGFGPPRSSGSGFWTVLEPNRTVFLVQTRTAGGLPRPVANTTCDRLTYPIYHDYWPLSTTHDACTILKYIMEVLRPFRYWAVWMLKRHTVTLPHVLTVYNDMFDHRDGVMRALTRKKTQWNED